MLSLNPTRQNLSEEELSQLRRMNLEAMEDIINMTSLAACGHPGGSMSSLQFLLLLYGLANINPSNTHSEDRDRIIISHGHISPGVYSVLAQYGFFEREEMVLNFRKTGSRYAGHVEHGVAGIEWNTGNLGQGISAGVGAALAAKLKGLSYKTVVCMGDGEQQKGQISEARRTALKYGLADLIVIVDYNHFQIGGAIQDVMPQNIGANYSSDGWNVLEVENGNDIEQVYKVLRKAWMKDVDNPRAPICILAKTSMGYGISFMSDKCDFHGRACTKDEHDKACQEMGIENRLEELKEKRAKLPYLSAAPVPTEVPVVNVDQGEPRIYGPDQTTDNRSAFGNALADLATSNNPSSEKATFVGISNDLEGSVKMGAFHKASPKMFLELGIQEHSNAVVGGRLSKEGFQVFFSTFGMFGVDEVYNQQRLNAFNETNLKVVCTHLGLNVGEDGPTHQNVDYIGLLKNIFGLSIFIPADPNQTDRMVRYAGACYGNYFIGMGRSKVPSVLTREGEVFFGKDYEFVPGKADLLREGKDGTILAIGPMVEYALKVSDDLFNEKGLEVRVLNLGSVVPFDRNAIIDAAKETGALVTVEDHHVSTGIGSIVNEVLVDERVTVPVKRLGVDRFSTSGAPEELYEIHGMGYQGIKEALLGVLAKK